MAMSPICLVEDCGKRAECQNFCKAHYSRFKRHGDPLAGRNTTAIALAWIKKHASHDSDECLIYPFRRRSNGYGEVIFRGKRMAANRVMCITIHGEPPTPKHHAAHSCGNGFGGCVNPRHIRWATKLENEHDKKDHGTIPVGERHGQSKLTEEEVRTIRKLDGTLIHAEIGKMFGVTRSAIDAIINRKNWGWLD